MERQEIEAPWSLDNRTFEPGADTHARIVEGGNSWHALQRADGSYIRQENGSILFLNEYAAREFMRAHGIKEL